MKRAPLLSAAVAAALTGAAWAGPIGINYVDTADDGVRDGLPDSLLPTESAGAPGYQQVGWNNMGRWGQTVGLKDSTGAATGATSTWDSANTWNDGAGVGSPDAKLMNGYLDATGEVNDNTIPYGFFNNKNKPEVYAAGLSAWLLSQGATSYKVVVYTDGDNSSGRKGEYWLQAGSGGDPPTILGPDLTSHVFVSDVSNFSGAFTEVPLSANTLATAGEGNFFVFTGLTADSFILRSEEYASGVAGDALRAQINGLQIIAVVPEPASLALLGIAATTLLGRRRRNK
ncbi:MAG TPA: PEP-CTERM sorting domain-containing protein [Tepidisphaeraceae bacterium]|nr:PEP-CTERM sorting domain-containing protein [Tepidisphaeraceae bacterium]